MCVEGRVLETNIADCWCIHQRHHLLDIIDEKTVEQIGVILLQARQIQVFVDRCSAGVDHAQGALALGFQAL